MTIRHVEVHVLTSARDAELLSQAGLPRLDLEPQTCSACTAKCGEIQGQNGAVFWKPCAVVLDGEILAVLCKTCLRPFDKVCRNLYA